MRGFGQESSRREITAPAMIPTGLLGASALELLSQEADNG